MYFPSRKITGIISIITLIMKLQCTLDAAYSVVVPNDKVMLPPIDAEHMHKQLGELSIEVKVNEEKLNKDALSLSAALSHICALIKQKKGETPECTALIREYQEKVLQQALKDPTKKGDVDQILSSMKAGADVTQVDEYGDNALHRAAEKGHEAAVRFFIPLFAKSGLLDKPGFNGRTPLHYACRSGDVECIKMLLAAGAQLAICDKVDNNALHYAADGGYGAAVQFLIPLFKEKGLLEAPGFYGRTALHKAATSGDVKCVIRLLDAGSNFKAVDKGGDNALHLAAAYGKSSVVLFFVPLFTKNNLLDVQNFNGRTALDRAKKENSPKTATLLWILGAKRPLSKEELPIAVQSAIKVIQDLTADEFEGLIETLGALHKDNIVVPGSFMAAPSPEQAQFLPLRRAIAERLSRIQREMKDTLQKSLPPEVENIAGQYLFGDITPSRLLNSTSKSASSSSSSSSSSSGASNLGKRQ